MTPSDLRALTKRCRKFWGTELRGMLPDDAFDDFVQNVALAVLRGDADDTVLGNVCRAVITDMRREMERNATVIAHAAFEVHGNALPTTFEVPFRTWGGARGNSGGARKGAGRPKKRVA